MSFMRATLSAVLITTLCTINSSRAASPESGQNWPQWRGPLATGAAGPEANPPVEFNETTNIKWKIKLPGHGSATPIVWEDMIFIQAAIAVDQPGGAEATGEGSTQNQSQPTPRGGRGGFRGIKPTGPYQFALICLNRNTGETVWQKVAREELPHEGHHRDHGFSSSSPVTDGEHVFAFFGSRGLYCYDMQGNLQWELDLGQMQIKLEFGEGSSPALSGDTLVVNWDHEGEDFIVALDKNTGDERWRQPRDEDTSWSTPLIVEHQGKAQVVTAATRKICSYDLESGQVIWECEGLTTNAIPSPVSANGIVYATSGFRGSDLFAIRLDASGDVTNSEAILWSHHKSTPYVPSPLLYENRLYFFSSNNGVLSSFDASSGQPVFSEERIGALSGVYASPVAAAGRIYLVGRDGTTVVIAHSDKLEILATNKLDDPIDASPAIAGKDLFLRGRQHLYCIAEK